MNELAKRVLITISIIAIQIAIDYFFNFGFYVIASIIPIIIINLPYKTPTPVALVIAFLVGVSIDLLSNTPVGLCTASLLLATLFRRVSIKLFIGKESLDKNERMLNSNIIPLETIAIITFSINFIYILTYIFLENFSFAPIQFNLLRLIISVTINSGITMLYYFITNKG